MGNHREIGHALYALRRAKPEYTYFGQKAFVSKKELLKHIQISERTLRRWVDRGMPNWIHKHRIFFVREEIIEWIEFQGYK